MTKKRRMIMVSIATAILIIGAGVIFSMVKVETISFKNPIGGMTNIGDPFVLKTDNAYYMYATSEASYGFKVWKSTNLVDWEEEGIAYDHYDQNEQWASGDFWAPEVIQYKGKYYMTYSARNFEGHLQISIATSEKPMGPFKDYQKQIIQQDGSYIDGHIFIEDDGTPYLYYVKDCSENIVNGNHVSQIYVQQMTEDLGEFVGDPILLLQPDQNWEGLNADYQWNEGPFLLKQDSKYYLMYSANYYASEDYSVGYAVADSPTGPFKKAVENPILAKDLKNDISGPGHNSVTFGPDGRTMYAVYHIHTHPQVPSGDRQMSMDKLYFEGGKLKIDGPSSKEQLLELKK